MVRLSEVGTTAALRVEDTLDLGGQRGDWTGYRRNGEMKTARPPMTLGAAAVPVCAAHRALQGLPGPVFLLIGLACRLTVCAVASAQRWAASAEPGLKPGRGHPLPGFFAGRLDHVFLTSRRENPALRVTTSPPGHPDPRPRGFLETPARALSARGSSLDLVDPAGVSGSGHQLLARWRRDEGIGRDGADNGWGRRRISAFVGDGRP